MASYSIKRKRFGSWNCPRFACTGPVAADTAGYSTAVSVEGCTGAVAVAGVCTVACLAVVSIPVVAVTETGSFPLE